MVQSKADAHSIAKPLALHVDTAFPAIFIKHVLQDDDTDDGLLLL